MISSRVVAWTVMACMVSGASRADLGLLSDQLKNSVMSELKASILESLTQRKTIGKWLGLQSKVKK